MTDNNVYDYSELVTEYANLKARNEDITNRINEIASILKTLGNGSHKYNGVNVTITTNRRLNATQFADQYPVKEHPTFYRLDIKPDIDVIRQHIPPATLDQYYRHLEPIVRVS